MFLRNCSEAVEVFYIWKKLLGLKPPTLLKKRLWHKCFPVNFAKFLFADRLRTTAYHCSNLSKLASNPLDFFFSNFQSRLTFYWKRHYSTCIPKNLNILIWFVSHSTEYLKLKWIDCKHFGGKRSVAILKIIYFLCKWFFEFSDLLALSLKNNLHRRRFRSNFCLSRFPFCLKDCLCFQVMQSRIQNHFKHISNIRWSFSRK